MITTIRHFTRLHPDLNPNRNPNLRLPVVAVAKWLVIAFCALAVIASILPFAGYLCHLVFNLFLQGWTRI
jgi:hypothetical protein